MANARPIFREESNGAIFVAVQCPVTELQGPPAIFWPPWEIAKNGSDIETRLKKWIFHAETESDGTLSFWRFFLQFWLIGRVQGRIDE